MLQPFNALGRTDEPARTAPHRISLASLPLLTLRMAAASRTHFWKFIRFRATRPLLCHHGNNLRDHIARPLHNNCIANTQVLAGNFILVMQRGIGHNHTANRDGPEPRDWRQSPRAPHLNFNTFQNRRCFFRSKLVGNGPAG